nr:restriction endonuclease subunit S [Aurantimonas marianensis]
MGWKSLPLAKIAAVFTDGNWIETKDQSTSGIRLVQTGNVGIGKFKDRREKARFIDEETFNRLKCFEVVPQDILISRLPDPVGRACIIPDSREKMITAVDCSIVRPKMEAVDPQFLVYYTETRSYLRDVDDRCTGTTRRRISRKNLGNVSIPLPPREEQKRIVALLDQAFASLDRARAHAEANLADATEIYDRCRLSIFDPETATVAVNEAKTIGDVCRIQSGAGFPVKEQGQTEGDYPFYKVSDMNLVGNEWRLRTANNYIGDVARKRMNAAVFPMGSIVFPKVGGAINTNKKRIVETAGCVDNNVMGLIPDEDKILPQYLHEWLYSVDIYEFSNKANPPSITQGTVSGWPIRVPERGSQVAAVERIKTLRNSIELLQNQYSETLADIADLRQSLLQKAFSGQLSGPCAV